jgi:hypothetical protein
LSFIHGGRVSGLAIISRIFMYAEDEHVAHPRLFGAPAYARPPLSITPTERPLDQDDLPIAAEQTEEERAIAEMLLSQPPAADAAAGHEPRDPGVRRRPVGLGAIAGRVLGRAS